MWKFFEKFCKNVGTIDIIIDIHLLKYNKKLTYFNFDFKNKRLLNRNEINKIKI
jgi:hypothetical protein